MTDSRYVLRPEARPMPYKALNESQQKAMKAIVAALKEAVEHSDEPPIAHGFIDHHRMSRLFFVSGQPGTGKTSIYITLCALLSDPDFRNKYKGCLDLDGLNGAICWLEPIDLEVAGDEGENLLAAVLVRIIRGDRPVRAVSRRRTVETQWTKLSER